MPDVSSKGQTAYRGQEQGDGAGLGHGRLEGPTVPTVLMAASSVVTPPAELGTEQHLIRQASQRAGSLPSWKGVFEIERDRGNHARLRATCERSIQHAVDRQRREVGNSPPHRRPRESA